MSADEAIRKAHEAKRLLEDPLFLDMVSLTSSEIVRAWGDTDYVATHKREELYHRFKGLQAVLDRLHAFKEGEAIAHADAEREARRTEWRSKYGSNPPF